MILYHLGHHFGQVCIKFGVLINSTGYILTGQKIVKIRKKKSDQAANGARFSFDEKGKQVENYEDHMVVEQCWIDRFRYQQHWNQPLKTVHCRIRLWWKI